MDCYSTYARTPPDFKYLKQARRANFLFQEHRIKRRYEIVSKRHDEYQYPPLEHF